MPDRMLTSHPLDPLFRARSIAVVGASSNPAKFGHSTMRSLLEGGYQGRVFPVNPNRSEILGLRAFPSVSDVPESIDLAVLIVPAEVTAQALEEAADKGAAAAVVLSAGFREAGRADLEVELLRVARQKGVRVLGPNIQGLSFLSNRMNAVFWPALTLQGPLGVVGQSGSVTAALSEWAEDEGLGVSAMVNLGNQLDICDWEVAEYLAARTDTRAIALYLESPRDGRAFFEAAGRIARDVPIAVLKPGRSAAGRKAALSHTGSLAGHDRVFDAACRQFGLVRANDVTTLYDAAKALALLGDVPGGRLLVVSTSGGCGTLAVDQAELAGLTIAAVPSDFTKALTELGLPSGRQIGNPVDFPIVDAKVLVGIVAAARSLGVADVVLLSIGDPVAGLAVELDALSGDLRKGLIVSYMGGGTTEKTERKLLHRAGFPAFPSPERATRAIAAAVWAANWRRSTA